MSSFKLNKISIAIFSYLISTLPVNAEIQSANQATNVYKKQGIEIVNIARPSEQGLSHNKYNKFNVDKQGAVLNNAIQNGRSVLAGELQSNPNLNNKGANVILNEVVSRNPSTLNGKQEVFGQRADYVLANPNGISCDGCGFINTPRASLVVGTPTVSQGKIQDYQVTNSNGLRATGEINNTEVDHLDFIAPKVEVLGNISGTKNINIVMGRGKVSPQTNGEFVATSSNNQGEVLDGRIMGSMYSGKIRIHSYDDRATLNIEGSNIHAKDVRVDAGNIDIKGKVTKTHNYTNYDRTDRNWVRAVGSVDSSQETLERTAIEADKVAITAKNNLKVSASEVNGKETVLIGNNITFGTQVTSKVRNTVHNQYKHLWARKESDFNNEKTLHRTSINADTLKMVAFSGKVMGEALKVTTNNLGIYAKQGIQFNGGTVTDRYTALSDFKRETWRLKTGNSRQDATVQHYTASEFNVKGQAVLGSEDSIVLSGTKFAVDGDLSIKAKNKVGFSTDSIQHTYSINDYHRFWGGLAGAKTVGLARNETIQYGADVTVKNNLHIEAEQGASITGSRVISKGNGYVLANKGLLSIDSAYSTQTKEQSLRQGGAFNITKLRDHQYSHSSIANQSQLKSESNLYLSTDKNLAVNGAQISAAGLLDISALSGVNIKGAANSTFTHTSNTQLSVAGKVEQPKLSVDLNYTSAVMLLLKSAIKENPIQNMVDGVKDKIKASVQGDASLKIQHTSEDRNEITHSASVLSGGKTSVHTDNLTLSGSKLEATDGNLDINANSINTNAQHNAVTSDKHTTNVAVGLTGKADRNEVSAKVGFNVDHTASHKETLTAQGSQLVAKNDVNLTSNSISHQGTAISAGGNVSQSADKISNSAATSHSSETVTTANVGFNVTTGVNKDKALNVNVGLNAEGGRTQTDATTSVVTSLNAASNIVSHSEMLNDQGTRYIANGDVSLTSKTHQLSAATDNTSTDKLSAGANVNVSASTKDMASVNLKVGVGGKFQKENSSSATEHSATVSGQNVNIQTGTLNSNANINAANNIAISASQAANFAQANKTTNAQGGGFNASVGVGALVVPATETVLPSIDVGVGVNGNSSASVTGSSNGLNAQNISVSAGNINAQGTSFNGIENVTLNAENVRIEATKNTGKNLSVDTALGVNVGAAAANSGFNAKFDVKTGNNQQHQNAEVTGKNVHISAHNANLNGVTTKAENLNLNVENLSLSAVENNKKQTDVGFGLSLSGNGVGNAWVPNAGGANVNVNVVRNNTHNSSSINADNANIQSGNTQLVGSAITAANLSGNINNLTEHTLVNRVNEVSLGLSATGSGKITPYTKDNFKENAKNDFKNGTLGGVKADAKVQFGMNIQRGNAEAGINATNNNVSINTQTDQGEKVDTVDRKLKVEISANTNLKALKEVAKTKEFPLVKVKIEK
ncbi:hemagglutinin repeat-containing protein [Haemophilus haemoglobinophilus]|nr:hemagglutinin repeat-containing protein [Canicola haemoglobinophilus]